MGVVAKALQETPPPVVGPQTAKSMAAVKLEDKQSELGNFEFGEALNKFHAYDMDNLQVPIEARPKQGQAHLGRHGYTIKSKNEVVECLLKTRAFVIKRANSNIAQPSKKPTGQVTWSKFGGPEKAWLETKLRAGW
ncbi:30S ribosomal protein S6 [Durusdinium trenchii]|uniref:30S ribosomal protein S6 n=2 Tax=Durusdinium trenchii TaxID=1381693 RepID=A0ABP0N5Q2_9DINO